MNDTRSRIAVVGGGLAGCEAALQIVKQGLKVKLYEMRPEKTTPAHTTDKLAELICSNSLGSMRSTRALGLLKEELRMLGSVLLGIAEQHSIPAGTGLTVDRKGFATEVTGSIEENPQIELIRKEIEEIPEGITVLASGPLTSDALSESLGTFCGIEYLYFYDAVAPIVSTDSLDMDKLIKAARYDSGEAGFLNSFMDKEQYFTFYEAIITAERHELHDADADKSFFEGCLPVEEIAKRGERSLAFGPLRPVGFRDTDGHRPYAVVQLRPEDRFHSMYNLVGFQTNLRNTEQERVLRLIPGLEKAEFLRYGRLHRNTYIEAPELIVPTLQFKKRKNLLVCGQLSGGEGYLSAVATGLVAGMNALRLCKGLEPLILPPETMLGALLERMAGKGEFASMQSRYSPTKPILALLPRLDDPPRSKETRRQAYADRSLAKLTEFLAELN